MFRTNSITKFLFNTTMRKLSRFVPSMQKLSAPLLRAPQLSSISRSNPLRGLQSFRMEHTRIVANMHSMENMLGCMQTEARTFHTVNPVRMRDLNHLKKVNEIFTQHHREKEQLLMEYGQNEPTYGVLKDMLQEHDQHACVDCRGAADSDFVIPSKNDLASAQQHLSVKDVLYPSMMDMLTTQEMEELSHKFEEVDLRHGRIINAMELLSDELNEKYKN